MRWCCCPTSTASTTPIPERRRAPRFIPEVSGAGGPRRGGRRPRQPPGHRRHGVEAVLGAAGRRRRRAGPAGRGADAATALTDASVGTVFAAAARPDVGPPVLGALRRRIGRRADAGRGRGARGDHSSAGRCCRPASPRCRAGSSAATSWNCADRTRDGGARGGRLRRGRTGHDDRPVDLRLPAELRRPAVHADDLVVAESSAQLRGGSGQCTKRSAATASSHRLVTEPAALQHAPGNGKHPRVARGSSCLTRRGGPEVVGRQFVGLSVRIGEQPPSTFTAANRRRECGPG